MVDKKTEKKIRILESAYQLFRTNSVASTAVDDVVKAAGIARGTFYLYFKDKSDLLEQMIFFKSTESMKQMLAEAHIRTGNGNAGFEETLKLFLNVYMDFLEAHKDILAVITKNLSSCLRLFPNFYDSEAEELYLEILKLFTDNGFSEPTANKTIYLLADMIGSVSSDAILTGRPFTMKELRPVIENAALSIVRGALEKEKEEKQNEATA